uniref:Complex 1 LYR protein domain-containing protein n=1 Tax=Ditylenchus dipsaci TaxID=166011 RepID=A0A915E9H8_9BILA
MTKKEILATYRKIFRIASRWTGNSFFSKIIFLKEILKNETRNQFRSNLQETDPQKIRAFLQDAEKKIEIAKHYRIPYDKPAYLPPSTSYDVNVKSKTFKVRQPKKGDHPKFSSSV